MVSSRDELLRAFAELIERTKAEHPELLGELRAEFDRLVRPAVAGTADDAEEWQGLIGRSPAMLELRRLIAKFGSTQAPVLITGESGTGKERVAHALHDVSPRKAQRFVAENCAAIPENLLESVLFGHKRGAFTGAVADHPGHFLHAHKGTLFLDEIGEMPMPMQAKLLRVLQEGEVRAVGDSKVKKVDVRLIAATNQDLEANVRAGRFREDLYFRLNVLRLSLPPLRERGDDIVLLAERFLASAAQVTGRSLRLSSAAKDVLRKGSWPGNVRQLQNEMQRVGALADGPEVGPGDLSPGLA